MSRRLRLPRYPARINPSAQAWPELDVYFAARREEDARIEAEYKERGDKLVAEIRAQIEARKKLPRLPRGLPW